MRFLNDKVAALRSAATFFIRFCLSCMLKLPYGLLKKLNGTGCHTNKTIARFIPFHCGQEKVTSV